MKILGWNCHGICNAATVRALKAHLKGNSPDVVFGDKTMRQLLSNGSIPDYKTNL